MNAKRTSSNKNNNGTDVVNRTIKMHRFRSTLRDSDNDSDSDDDSTAPPPLGTRTQPKANKKAATPKKATPKPKKPTRHELADDSDEESVAKPSATQPKQVKFTNMLGTQYKVTSSPGSDGSQKSQVTKIQAPAKPSVIPTAMKNDLADNDDDLSVKKEEQKGPIDHGATAPVFDMSALQILQDMEGTEVAIGLPESHHNDDDSIQSSIVENPEDYRVFDIHGMLKRVLGTGAEQEEPEIASVHPTEDEHKFAHRYSNLAESDNEGDDISVNQDSVTLPSLSGTSVDQRKAELEHMMSYNSVQAPTTTTDDQQDPPIASQEGERTVPTDEQNLSTAPTEGEPATATNVEQPTDSDVLDMPDVGVHIDVAEETINDLLQQQNGDEPSPTNSDNTPTVTNATANDVVSTPVDGEVREVVVDINPIVEDTSPSSQNRYAALAPSDDDDSLTEVPIDEPPDEEQPWVGVQAAQQPQEQIDEEGFLPVTSKHGLRRRGTVPAGSPALTRQALLQGKGKLKTPVTDQGTRKAKQSDVKPQQGGRTGKHKKKKSLCSTIMSPTGCCNEKSDSSCDTNDNSSKDKNAKQEPAQPKEGPKDFQ